MNHQDTKAPREPIPQETDKVASKIVDAAFAVHTALGPGLLQSVYEACLLHELQKRGLKAERQVSLPVAYDGLHLDAGLRLDLVVESGAKILRDMIQHQGTKTQSRPGCRT